MFKTLSASAEAEIVEKKSKFIANVFCVESVEEAEEKIKELKKKFYNARHNCYAFSIYTETGNIDRFSDDGEPSGTAGAPILNLITSQGLTNILVVVTRYFGGILLGTGGLVRAYTEASQKALNIPKESYKALGIEVKLKLAYSDLEKLKYYLKQNNIEVINVEYKEEVEVYINITKEEYNNLLNNQQNYKLNFNLLSEKIIREKYIEIGKV